jgi:hypothetical protein
MIGEAPGPTRNVDPPLPSDFLDFFTDLHDGWCIERSQSRGVLPSSLWQPLANQLFDREGIEGMLFDPERFLVVSRYGALHYLGFDLDQTPLRCLEWSPERGTLLQPDPWAAVDDETGRFLEAIFEAPSEPGENV